MMSYKEKVERELKRWEHKINRPPSLPAGLSKRWQNKINNKIPEKIHNIVTESVKHMVQATLVGSDYLSELDRVTEATLEERDRQFDGRVAMYKRTAAVEGAGTGFGGIMLGLADFPLLLTIKMKCLFDAGKIYGFNTDEPKERLFLLHIFQLAFSKEVVKKNSLEKVKSWDELEGVLREENGKSHEIDWRTFQLEYRDFIDLPKTLQLVPGFGALVGATANYHYLEILAHHTKNSFRYRLLTHE
ncbi:EcsC family protein [Salipaludibacillus agaradhaerens]|uniref:EcsC family protein n=1 Tax=Salipaludibacillus agaradhaerens TaxID=76935 RepID=A0A9Q4FZR2_SALAG|nr:EcsC family protein [Salipaludibacillus agaradhaerens]MCR6097009.1 EcsC family protein [Salipaludibacillus agaradhaerens]MCR6113506.1 EcsC family protein [Salipaludibacillus agaradhaerens]